MRRILLQILLSLLFYNCGARVLPYPAPQGATMNLTDYHISVRQNGEAWQDIPVYLAKVAHTVEMVNRPELSSFAYFDMSGEVEVKISFKGGEVKSAKIRPANLAPRFLLNKNDIVFKIAKPAKYSIEVNGNLFQNLHLFANAIDADKPKVNDPKVMYFGPGIHEIGNQVLQSGQKVYIDGGAVVRGRFIISHRSNISIKGRGILTQMDTPTAATADTGFKASDYAGGRTDAITVEYAKDIEIEGIIILPHKYTVLMGESSNVSINNIKSFSNEGNGDGIDIFCSSHILINDVFLRNSDDCIAIYGHRWNYYGNATDITVKGAILWADLAHPILVGTHGDSIHPDTLAKMRFSDIDVLDQHENQLDYQGCLALNAGDDNLISDIIFDGVRVENIRRGQLINLRVMFNAKYNTSPGRGIKNVLFKDLSYNGSNADISVIVGFDRSRQIENIAFENLMINGRQISDGMPGKPSYYKTADVAKIFIGEHVANIRFRSGKEITNENASQAH